MYIYSNDWKIRIKLNHFNKNKNCFSRNSIFKLVRANQIVCLRGCNEPDLVEFDKFAKCSEDNLYGFMRPRFNNRYLNAFFLKMLHIEKKKNVHKIREFA